MTAPAENPYPTGPEGPLYLTTHELAERFRTADSTVRYWRSRGEGPLGVQFGSRVLYPLPEVERWERERFDAAVREQRVRLNPLSTVAPLRPDQPKTTASSLSARGSAGPNRRTATTNPK